jgi:hypothetical protein
MAALVERLASGLGKRVIETGVCLSPYTIIAKKSRREYELRWLPVARLFLVLVQEIVYNGMVIDFNAEQIQLYIKITVHLSLTAIPAYPH